MKTDRLHKVISSSGYASKRRAEELIREGRVSVNSEPAIIGQKVGPLSGNILIDGKTISRNFKPIVILLNKQNGIICSCNDLQGRKTVLSLISSRIRNGLHPIGPLDLESRGAILLTNHRDLTLKLTHPKFNHTKTYLAWLKGMPKESILEKLRNGIKLEGKWRKLKEEEWIPFLNTKMDSKKCY